jgi:serine/threonine protein kinase/serine phosphatase RsbU (regulator of sigma subunit)
LNWFLGVSVAATKLNLGLSIGGFKIIDELGSGASSVVYRVERDSKQYAMKVIHPGNEEFNLENLIRIRKETAAVARLNHPAIVQIFEVGEDPQISYPYIVMELIDGETFDQMISRGPLKEDLVVQFAKTIAEGLTEIHKYQMVHRDIKPANIMVEKLGKVKILDLGLANQGNDNENTGDVVGTLAYCSPEQGGMLKRAVDGRSDLYSLGVTMYQALTGQLPFAMESVADLLRHHAAIVAVPVHQVDPQISQVLSDIVAKLMAKDPDDRYQTARGLLSDLERISELKEKLQHSQNYVLGENDVQGVSAGSSHLSGRDSEMAYLRKTWDEARAGRGKVVFIEGEGGSGKSRLSKEIISLATDAGALILPGKCNLFSSGVPYAPFREAFDETISRLKSMATDQAKALTLQLQQSAAGSEAVIGRLSFGLQKLFASSSEVHLLDVSASQERLIAEASKFILELSKRRGSLVLAIDDVQWSDPLTGDILQELSRHIDSFPLLIILTARNDDDSRDSVDRLKEHFPEKNYGTLSLEPLPLAAVESLIQSYLGHRPMSSVISEKIATLANGNPFVIGESVGALLAAGDLFISNGRWHLNESGVSQLELTKDVFQLVLYRIAKISSPVKAALEYAVVIGSRFQLSLLAAALDIEESEVQLTLQEAIKNNLIEALQAGNFQFSHDRIREAILGQIESSRHREINDRLSACLEKQIDRPSESIFELARFYAEGNIERSVKRVVEVNLQAGELALSNYASGLAFQKLAIAEKYRQQAGLASKQEFLLLELLGTAAMNIGKLEEAHVAFRKAHSVASSDFEKASLLHLETRAFSSAGRIQDAWEVFARSLAAVGESYPVSRFWFFATMVGFLFLTYFLTLTRIGYGRYAGPKADPLKREKMKLICSIFETSYVNAVLLGSPLDLAQISFRQFKYAHYLGDSHQLSRAHCVLAILWSLALARPIVRFHQMKANAISTKLDDPALRAYLKSYFAICSEFMGDAKVSSQLSRESFPDSQKYLGTFVCSQIACDLLYQYSYKGMAREAVDWFNSTRDYLRDTNNYCLIVNMLGIHYYNLVVLGRLDEAQEIHKEWLNSLEKVKTVTYSAGNIPAMEIYVATELEDHGPATLQQIEDLLAFGMEDYHFAQNHIPMTQIRLMDYLAAKTPEQKAIKRKAFDKALLNLNLRAIQPLPRSMYYCLKGSILRSDRKYQAALKFLEKGDLAAHRAGSLRAHFEIACERARVYLALGENLRAEAQVQFAHSLSVRQGWTLKQRRIEKEFVSVVRFTDSQNTQKTISDMTIGGRSSKMKLSDRRILDSLLQVSLASSLTIDPLKQAESAIDEIVRVMGADRAFIFICNEETGELVFRGGRDSKMTTLTELTGYSSTVVRKVQEEKKALVVTGTDSMEAIASQSAISHNLRSIMAAPLFIRDHFVGVIYIDSRLSKGLFTEDDVDVLKAIGNHVAISFETTRMAQVEAQRREFSKDLEISAAVQKLFLPKERTFQSEQLSLSGYYRAASQCSGDWWWYDVNQDRLTVIVADVTGHGAGPAMITASVASSFGVLQTQNPEIKMPDLLQAVHNELQKVGDQAYLMSTLAIDVDLKTGALESFSAASIGFYVISKSGTISSYLEQGSLLGYEELHLGQMPVQLQPGDRVFVCTDGIVEAPNAADRAFGERNLKKLLLKTMDLEIEATIDLIAKELDQYRGGTAQNDDFTFVLFEVKSPKS